MSLCWFTVGGPPCESVRICLGEYPHHFISCYFSTSLTSPSKTFHLLLDFNQSKNQVNHHNFKKYQYRNDIVLFPAQSIAKNAYNFLTSSVIRAKMGPYMSVFLAQWVLINNWLLCFHFLLRSSLTYMHESSFHT